MIYDSLQNNIIIFYLDHSVIRYHI